MRIWNRPSRPGCSTGNASGAATFWSISDPHLALRVHAVVGGTPAYGREFVRGDAPSGPADFDDWVRRTVLNPQTPLFREARYLLAEETDIEGPHFEAVCRTFATLEGAALFSELPGEVGHGTVNDATARTQIEVDVAVLAVGDPDAPRRVLSLGEAKWGEVMGLHHLRRLARARDLLAAKRYDTSATVLACYSAAGFDQELRAQAASNPGKILLIGPAELYAPSVGQ